MSVGPTFGASVGKKVSLFTAVTVLLGCLALGWVSYVMMESKLAEALRKDTLDAATLLSSRVRNELRHAAEKGRILAAAALEEFKNPDDQIRFLEENLAMDEQLVAMTLFRRSGASNHAWVPVFRLTRPEGDPAHLSDADFGQLDLKFPIDLNLAGDGAIDTTVGQLKDGTPILRMLVPIVRKSGGSFTQVLGLEMRQERITAAFAEATAYFSFILDRNGRVLIQTDPTHFTLGEDASNLPILQMAEATDAPNGNLDYYELPGGVLQYGSFHKVGYADLTVITQCPRTYVIHAMRDYTRQAVLVAFACSFFAMALGLLASWGIIGARLSRIGAALRRMGDGQFAVSFPEKYTVDEIGVFARTLQDVCDELKERDRVHGTVAKIKSRKIRAKIEEGKINVKGERMNAMVLTCHLHGIEDVVAKADAELLVSLLNHFNQAVSDCIETSQGIVDHIHGGSVVAYWGIPIADKKDAEHALFTAIEIRKFAHILNGELKKADLPEVMLGMGIHYGPVIAGQVGTEDRLEYTAIGEALEVSSRITTFTDQFGTDLLITEQAKEHAPASFEMEQVADGDENNPPFYEVVNAPAKPTPTVAMVTTPEGLPVKRKRGRPKKVRPTEETASASAPSTKPAGPSDSDQAA